MSRIECMEIEKKIAFHSAPSLLGVKCANLIALNRSEFDVKSYAEFFNCKGKKYGLQFRILCSCKEKVLVLIYHEKLLNERLKNIKIQHFLYSYGYYMNCNLHYYLKKLSERISCYDEFPHEIGAFLDYPYEDIVGFIANKGKNFKMCGCWKVYGDTATAERTFNNYDKCRNYLCYKLNSGVDIFSVIQEVYIMKTAVIYWSGTGNTESMAQAIAEGAGAELFTVSEFSGDISVYDRLAFGCSAMGAEVLEEDEFEPFFTSIEGQLNGKTVLLFGSYGWGDGEWMRNWADRTAGNGAILLNGEGFIVNETPDDSALAECKALGKQLAE